MVKNNITKILFTSLNIHLDSSETKHSQDCFILRGKTDITLVFNCVCNHSELFQVAKRSLTYEYSLESIHEGRGVYKLFGQRRQIDCNPWEGGPLVKSSGARLSECQLCFAPRSVTRCRDVVKSVDASDLELSSVICHKHGSRENCGKANLARNVNNFVLSPICNTAWGGVWRGEGGEGYCGRIGTTSAASASGLGAAQTLFSRAMDSCFPHRDRWSENLFHDDCHVEACSSYTETMASATFTVTPIFSMWLCVTVCCYCLWHYPLSRQHSPVCSTFLHCALSSFPNLQIRGDSY